MGPDPLAGAAWQLTSDSLAEWISAQVPGTVAGALHAAGRWDPAAGPNLDGQDWWYRTTVDVGVERDWWLHAAGLATIVDVWVDDHHVLHGDNMFTGHWIELGALGGLMTLTLRFAALDPMLALRRPRPRWKSRLVRHQNLRWVRTSLQGRMPAQPGVPAPVGPWRDLSMHPSDAPIIFAHHLRATPTGTGGTVEVTARGRFGDGPTLVTVGDTAVPAEANGDGLRATVALDHVQRWWPHTHGSPHCYPVGVQVGDEHLPLGQVGFRNVDVDRSGGGWTLRVNDVALFARGACWVGADPVGLNPNPSELRAELERYVTTGFNLVRVPGTGVYESEAFWTLCDELGILVWCEAMLANLDLPDEPDFIASVIEELAQVVGRAAGHPSLAVVCGGSEVEQQAAMLGLPPDTWAPRLIREVIPRIVDTTAPGVPYVTSSPTGGDFPFSPGTGVAHYFGVGAYLRPLDDARRAGVRFASECLALSIPPEVPTVDLLGGAAQAGHDSRWKAAVPRDAAASWDFEDVRDHYTAELFGIAPAALRATDPELALDLGRAAAAEVMVATLAEWRRGASSCAGAVILAWRDLLLGAGWGLIDASGTPKAPWYALRRLLAPISLWLVDEGLNGLRLHVANDHARPLHATVTLRFWATDGRPLAPASTEVSVDGHDVVDLNVETLLGGFRDLTYAYRFGPPAYDVILAEGPGTRAFYLPLGSARPRTADCGLDASAVPLGGGDDWKLTVTTRGFAHYVSIVVAGFEPSDNWFHLEPDGRAEIHLRRVGTRLRPTGEVRALNSVRAARVTIGG